MKSSSRTPADAAARCAGRTASSKSSDFVGDRARQREADRLLGCRVAGEHERYAAHRQDPGALRPGPRFAEARLPKAAFMTVMTVSRSSNCPALSATVASSAGSPSGGPFGVARRARAHRRLGGKRPQASGSSERVGRGRSGLARLARAARLDQRAAPEPTTRPARRAAARRGGSCAAQMWLELPPSNCWTNSSPWPPVIGRPRFRRRVSAVAASSASDAMPGSWRPSRSPGRARRRFRRGCR